MNIKQKTFSRETFWHQVPSSAWLDFKTVPEYDDLFSTECEKVEAIGKVLLQKFDNLTS